jgi:hypothetical protein
VSGEKKNESKRSGGGRLGSFYRGRGVAASFFDWPRMVAAHLLIGLGGRQDLWRKEMKRHGWPKLPCIHHLAGSIHANKNEQCERYRDGGGL